ncbi:valacyclovir hydrolase-like isoform X1 [Manduca sexta]|uniref:valacyclovir hydrolase-like isoform X1 n=1 Tax=Manduca sexta TaxID=7130 RepID=UPI00188F0E38|nr:valacyclovir hydrolase-like isoform X1 [Manduca sexta]
MTVSFDKLTQQGLYLFNMYRILSKVHKVTKFNSNPFFSTSCIPQEEKIKVGKYNINYIKVGTGPHNVLCMPGIFGTIWTDFKPQIEGLDRNKFTVITWDPPGHGKSRPPEKELSLDFLECDADYAYNFMKALNIEKYSVLGWSAGGTMSLIHAAKYPDVMRKLVIWGTSSFILPHELKSYKNMSIMSNWSKSSYQAMTAIYGEENFAKNFSKFVDAMVGIYNKKNGNFCLERLSDIKCPTFILHGKQDQLIDKFHASYFNTYISESRSYIYPEGKHNIHIKYAEDFNKRVQEFLLE